MRWFLYVETHLRNISASPFIWNGLVVLAVLAIAAVLPRLGNSLFSAVERCGCRIAERRGLAIVLIAAATILLRLLLLPWVPVPVPEVHDEFSYLLAADTFTRGHLANTPHPMWLYFDTFHVNQHPSYMSIYPPAQGAVLALGQILGNPWIGVLLSSAAMCAAVVWALQGWLPPRWALLGGILLLFRLAVFSYWMNSYWGGAVAALGGALVIGALPRIIRFRRSRDGIILGIGVVILANSRPFEGLIFCLPVAGALMIWLARNRRLLWGSFVLPFLAIVLLGASFGAYYNWRGTGDPFLPPYILNVRSHFSIPQLVWQEARPPLQFQNAQFDAYYNVFWKNIARPIGTKAIRGAWMERLQYSVGFFLWPELCLPFLALPWMLRDRRVQLLICQLAISIAGFMLVVWLLPHYAAPLTGTIFALVAQGTRHLRTWHWGTRPVGIALSRATVLCALVLSPYHLSLSDVFPRMKERAAVEQQLDRTSEEHLVIVRYSLHHNVEEEWVQNRADIDHAKVVWAREIAGVSVAPLLAYFNGRQLWLLEPDVRPVRLRPYPQEAEPAK